jgi:hypothetical protein
MIRYWENNQKYSNWAIAAETAQQKEVAMVYASPQIVDFNEVYVLNKSFLSVLSAETEARRLLGTLPADLAGRLSTLTRPERRRLAAAPFLLFSLREDDDEYWDGICAGGAGRDLFDTAAAMSDDCSRLVAAALGYLSQMARQNPYTLRVISFAPLHWCERLAEEPLMHVINRSCRRADTLQIREPGNAEIWRKMLGAGLHRRNDIRSAAHHAVLQSLIILPRAGRPAAIRSAACRTRTPALEIADEE